MPSRNFILIVGLALFLMWYVSDWAYQSLYLAPRKQLGSKITELSQQIEWGKADLNAKQQFNAQCLIFYYRTLPASANDARSQYTFWLLELLQYSGFENPGVDPRPHTLVPAGANYQFNIQCTGSLSQFSYFLFEFYYAPFLHRITSMTLTPVEGNAEQLRFSMSVNALALRLNPRTHPPRNEIPNGIIPRLMSNDLTTYQVIANRNLLQTAKGGIDRADYTVLSSVLHGSDPKEAWSEVWFYVQTDESTVKKRLGETFQFGSFSGKVVEILDEDVVLERNGERWLLGLGEKLNKAFALPPETGEMEE